MASLVATWRYRYPISMGDAGEKRHHATGHQHHPPTAHP